MTNSIKKTAHIFLFVIIESIYIVSKYFIEMFNLIFNLILKIIYRFAL